MRSAILQLPDQRTALEQRRVLRAAIRQVERADLYLAAIIHMDLGDAEAESATRKLRADLERLRRYLTEQRADQLS
jgi:hypothetical protein